MLGRTCQKFKRFNKAYSLAEVLVVMAIIMLIFLALPPVTKKVFKITDTRKAHGRFECYWDVDADGKKALYSYYSDESGLIDGPKKIDGEKCTFTPTSNTLYYMIHAVGGGGAGAVIATQKDEHGNTIVTEDLTPKNTKVQAVSYLAKSAVNAWPNWVSWLSQTNKCKEIPWRAKTPTGEEYCPSKVVKDQFDVNTISDMQQVRYRLSGSAGKVVSSFVPQLPGSLRMDIYPGQGGVISRKDSGSGKDGTDTVIKYVYPDDTEGIQALKAAGGAGGSGEIDSRMSFTLVGGKPTDFLMSTKTSIAKKLSGFIDVIESSEKYEAMRSHVPSNAGDGGSGETQFVAETAGEVLYEYDNNDGVFRFSRRYGSKWTNVTNVLSTKYYTEDNVSTVANCEAKKVASFEAERTGYCDLNKDATNNAKHAGYYNRKVYDCAIGDIPESVISNISELTQYKYPRVDGKSTSLPAYADREKVWQVFRVVKNTTTGAILGTYPMFPSSSLYSDGTVYNDDYSQYSDGYKYNNKLTPFYGCYVNADYLTLKCKTIMKGTTYKEANLVPIHDCTVKDSNNWTCSNGEKAMCSNGGTTYTNCTDVSKLKCPAHNGGDGAVVILW